MSRRFFNRD